MMREVILTQKQLEERLSFWQEKLRLRDWYITVSKGRTKVVGEKATGCVHAVHSNKQAHILILHEEDYVNMEESDIWVQDMESILVHELLHLHTRLINKRNDEDADGYCMFEEQAIESITSALITLARGQ
ncbi:hypothetical protein ACE106_15250 [Shouchella clausii]|uniref:hypothetical protein n=1 Tax=Shouchella clausii TaxID=79880 RepID=UPI0028A09B98|nr:hypothetical protein [Shouchella clausii]